MASSALSRPFPLRAAAGLFRRAATVAAAAATRLRRARTPGLLKRYDRLHLGCGARLLPGWANLDINGLGALVWDLRKPLPVPVGQVKFVYTEHFIEHVGRDDAKRLFTHARRAMAPGGVVRVSTPDLKRLVDDYCEGRLVRMDHGMWYPETLCRMVNEGMRSWGHAFLYDEPELAGLLEECGFRNVRRVAWGESVHADLRGLESRPDFGDLIIEAEAGA
ncbi:MAG TPA: methyltransferase domain-containing protein [Allosphingosinicella sp.]|jgi:predicted SAM-dependent methyltransferase